MALNRARACFRVLLIALCISMIAGCGSQMPTQPADQASSLKIGVLFPLTGDAASYGEKGKRAIDMAVASINAEGGVNGRTVEVIYEDSRAEPKTGVSAMKKLVEIDKVPAVVGDIVSSVTLPVAPIAEKSRVVLMSPTSSAPAITDAGEYIYRIWPSDLAEGSALAEFAVTRGLKTVAIFHLNNDYGLSIASIFSKTFEEKGGRVLLKEGYLAEATDFRAALTKIKRASPDAVYIAGYYADTSVIVKQARELGLEVQFLGTTAIEDEKFLELAGAAAEGMIYPLATGFDPASDSTMVRNFIVSFKKDYGYEPGWVEAQCYDAFKLLCWAAAEVNGPVTGTAIKQSIDRMSEYEGVTGTIKFDKNGDVSKSVTFKTVRGGRFQSVSDSG